MVSASFTETQLRAGVDLSSLAEQMEKPSARGASAGAGETPGASLPVGELRVRAGLPLHVTWTTFYTGDISNRKALLKGNRVNQPVLLTSAIKSSADAAPASRAFLATWEETKHREEIFTRATDAGTNLVYYSAAVARGLTLTIHLFEKPKRNEVFDRISASLKVAASFPPLAFASGYLLIGSRLTQVAGGVVDALRTDKHSFVASQQVYVADDYPALTEPRYTFFSPDTLHMEDALMVRLSDSGKPHLVDKASGKRYGGPNAYVICRYSPQEVEDLMDFDVRAEALALLEGWMPTGEVEVDKLMQILVAGLKEEKRPT